MLRAGAGWDRLILLPGTMMPVGAFESCDFDSWSQSFQVNFLGQMQLLQGLLPARSKGGSLGPLIVFFSGSGSNSAPVNLSAYTISKIALTKMCELLDAEIPDVRTVVIGPGWIKTKIHKEMLAAGPGAGEGYRRTIERLGRNDFTPMESVLAFLDWLENQPREAIGGRNFSAPNDPWEAKVLVDELVRDGDMYKLRRHRNFWKP
jgi:NAD(P)-dependent dehydrogenase (short-subunit alcohol dehydrogenase family)